MTVQGQMFERVAICTARVAANNYFSVSQSDVRSTNLEAGDEVRVMLIKTDTEKTVNGRDRDVYDNTLQKSNQVYIPANTRDKLGLETGDIVKYVVVPKKSFPGIQGGPVRNKAREVINGGSEEKQEEEPDRPERQTSSDTFTAPMQKTGQVTIPSDTREKMALLQGDTVFTTIRWQGKDITRNKDIGTGNRITITKDEREDLGLEPGDEPEMRIAVFD